MSDAKPTDRSEEPPAPNGDEARSGSPRRLTPEAERALAEAAARRAERARNESAPPEEIGGRGGLDPTRYGDWEINGLTPDF
jgi:hypothetical protein